MYFPEGIYFDSRSVEKGISRVRLEHPGKQLHLLRRCLELHPKIELIACHERNNHVVGKHLDLCGQAEPEAVLVGLAKLERPGELKCEGGTSRGFDTPLNYVTAIQS